MSTPPTPLTAAGGGVSCTDLGAARPSHATDVVIRFLDDRQAEPEQDSHDTIRQAEGSLMERCTPDGTEAFEMLPGVDLPDEPMGDVDERDVGVLDDREGRDDVASHIGQDARGVDPEVAEDLAEEMRLHALINWMSRDPVPPLPPEVAAALGVLLDREPDP